MKLLSVSDPQFRMSATSSGVISSIKLFEESRFGFFGFPSASYCKQRGFPC